MAQESEIDRIKAYREKYGCTFAEATRAVRSTSSEESKPATIPHSLLEAYKGYYEDKIHQDFPYSSAPPPGKDYDLYREQFEKEWATEKIRNDLPKEHLRVYLAWNGIIGYDEQIFNIANGFWFNKD